MIQTDWPGRPNYPLLVGGGIQGARIMFQGAANRNPVLFEGFGRRGLGQERTEEENSDHRLTMEAITSFIRLNRRAGKSDAEIIALLQTSEVGNELFGCSSRSGCQLTDIQQAFALLDKQTQKTSTTTKVAIGIGIAAALGTVAYFLLR
jgi:hypothetical protein